MQTASTSSVFTWKHFGVIGLGLLVFVLLLFADKTNLNNNPNESVRGNEMANTTPPESSSESANGKVVTDNNALNEKINALETATDPETKKALLKEIVEGFQEEGQTAAAAQYAAQLADLDPTAENYLVSGALFRFASHQGEAKVDSVQFKALNRQALAYLQKAVELDPKNEGALIELGLTHIESGEPGSGMTGILKLREVTEINPRNTEAGFHLGVFSYDTGQFEKAVDRFRKVLEIEPDNLIARYYLGISQQQMGDARAFKEIMEGLAKQTQDTVIAAKARSLLQNN